MNVSNSEAFASELEKKISKKNNQRYTRVLVYYSEISFLNKRLFYETKVYTLYQIERIKEQEFVYQTQKKNAVSKQDASIFTFISITLAQHLCITRFVIVTIH